MRNGRRQRITACLGVTIVAAAWAGCGSGNGGGAGGYPEQPPRFVVPYDAGGGVDAFARAFETAAAEYDFSMRIEYIPGGSAIQGTREVLNAEPDGSTLLFSSLATNATNPIQSNGDFTPSDFDYICALAGIAYVIIVPPDDDRTAEEIFAVAVDDPGELSFASAGPLGSDAVGMYSILNTIDGEMQNVPFDSGSEAIAAVAGGHVPVGVASAAPGLEAHNGGLVRAIAVTSPERLEQAEDVPTVAEVTGEEFEYFAYLGITGPKGMPDDVTDYLTGLCEDVGADEGFIEEIESQGNNSIVLIEDEFEAYNQELIDTVIEPVLENLES